MLKVVGAVNTRAMRVLWLAEELGLDYEHVDVHPHDPAVTALNPLGKVPVLVDDDMVLTDSTAILTWLAEKHGRFTYPAGTPERARQNAITHFILDQFEGVIWTATRHSFILPKERRMPAIKDSLRWEFGESQRHFARLLDGEYLMPEFTIADIIAGHCGLWAKAAKFPIGEPLGSYTARMLGRPAAQRAAAR
jgi:glutathione S-transferase